MENILYSIFGIMIPFLGTTLGSSFVFFIKENISDKFQKLIIGFASGVMLAASVWSLILPSIEMATSQNQISWLPALIGISSGVLFLILIYKIAEKMENKNSSKKFDMLIFSVTIHNIPEGMAVGVCFAGFLSGNAGISFLEAIVLAIGIAIQNIPEGTIISIPERTNGINKSRAFLDGVLSGIVEPIAAIITIIFINIVLPILSYLLAFAAGAMMFVIIEELIPEMHEGKKSIIGVIGFTVGFNIMMMLDIIFG